MDAKDLAMFQELLLQLKRKLTDNIDQLQNDALKTAGDSVNELSDVPSEHMADRGSDNFTRDLMVQILENSDAEVCDINVALEKIEAGSYGLCEGCSEPVSRKRLRALPFARLCIECKHEEERADGEA